MPRRFQFSLRGLLVAVLLVTLPLGVYCWLRNMDGTVIIGRAVVGKPFTIRARFLVPKSVELKRQAAILVYASAGHPLSNMRVSGGSPIAGAIKDWRRSAFFLVEAEVEVTLPLPGRYLLRVDYPLAKRRIDGEVLVEANETG